MSILLVVDVQKGFMKNNEYLKLSNKIDNYIRKNKYDKIDYSAGVIINKNINDIVEVGDTIMTLYTNKEVPNIDINKLFIISNNKNDDNKLIYEVIE